jgi:ParB family chromosome partitioning protein
MTTTQPQQRFAMIPIGDLEVAENVRRQVGDVDELAANIAAHGMLEPIVVCPSADGEVIEVLMGQRRFAAARLAGLELVPCILRARPDERDRVIMQLSENLQRAEMSPIDEALAFQDLVELGVSRRAIAHLINRSESEVGKRLRLLDYPETVRVAVDLGWIRPATVAEIPTPLCTDTDALARLGKVIVHGDDAVRSWIRSEAARRSHSAATRVVRKGVRVLNVSLEGYELAVAEARKAGVGLGEWTTAAVFAYAAATNEEHAAA